MQRQTLNFKLLTLAVGFMVVTFISFAPTSEPVSAAVSNGAIVYHVQNGGVYDIYRMEADGSNPKNLTNGSSINTDPGINASGDTIVFVSNRDGDYEIYTMDMNGNNLTQLTFNSVSETGPVWSHGGDKIAYASNVTGNYEIYSMNSDGSGVSQLTNTGNFTIKPSWSRAGEILFHGGPTGTNNIYKMQADGSNVQQLTTSGGDLSAEWSPGGTRIAFKSNRHHAASEIYTMNSDGTGVTRLTNNGSSDGDPSWSPDGSKIAFFGCRTGAANNCDIFTMDSVSGANPTQLTDTTTGEAYPVWQPLGIGTDSTQISATLAPTISLSTSGSVDIDVLPSGTATMSSAKDTVSVSTNSSTGYSLQFSNTDTNLKLRDTNNAANIINEHSATTSSPTVLSNYTWGYRVDGVGGFGGGPTVEETNVFATSYTWAGTPSSDAPQEITNTSGPGSNDATDVWFGVRIGPNTSSATYTDEVTYTAVTN